METLYCHVSEAPVDTEHWERTEYVNASGEPLYRHVGDGEIDADVWVEDSIADPETPAEPAADEQRTDGQPDEQPQKGLAAAEANPSVGSSPVSEQHIGTNVPPEGSEEPARQVDQTGPDTTDALTTEEHVARFANNGSTDRTTTNEDDQPEAYVPPPAGPGAPDAPQITSPEGGATVATQRTVITGTGANGNLIYLEEGEGQFPVNPATVADGAFRFVVTLEPGEHELSVRQRNAAGDVSDPSESIHITVDSPANLDDVEDPNERFALFLRDSVLTAPRLGWDLFAELKNQASAWLDSQGK